MVVTTAAHDGHALRLRRVLGVAFGVAVGVGGAMGVGILRVPALVAARLPNATWIALVWVCVALYLLIDANSVAELATMLPAAGGPYLYVTRAFGEFAGFVVGWVDWIINTAAIAFVAVAFADFLAKLWPAPGRQAWLPAALIVAFTGLHWLGVRVGGRAQVALSAAKAGGFLLVAAACLWSAPAPPLPSPSPAAMMGATDVAGAVVLVPGGLALLAAFAGSWRLVQESFAGAMTAVYFGEESADPSRGMPRALFGSVLVIAAVYLLIVAAVVHVLGTARLAHSTLPLADAARVSFGEGGRRAVLAVALVSLLGLLNANVMFTPRILFAIARGGLFTGRATAVNAGGTPVVALLITAGVALPLALTNTFEQLFGLTAFLGLTTPLGVGAALLVLRRREPALSRPYRARGYPWLPLIGVVVPAVAMVSAVVFSPRGTAVGLALFAVAYPVFRVIARRAPLAAT